MNSKPWSHPVKFETSVGQFRIIMTTEDAARYLLNGWPIDDGEKLIAARRACLDALEDEVPAAQTRKAFIEACEEAGMYVMPAWQPTSDGSCSAQTFA
ncbi:DUF982 domain-containing protein [Labrys sp. KNU-23]|uniref:DUF982 domain-containing protein n=1 Tax=Labrys sp. KNU-23 TaxID=2789216 RepID=UPI00165BC97C|nr:DUF982 domain-containing protein [Labrys sp. KNU-23]